jgi:Response regulator containing CheY-like receiver, AAA-type ATPase, and DNA-binding domains
MFMTAFGDIEQAVRLMRAGADDYVIKPFQMDEFLGRIDHLLKRRGIVEASRSPPWVESESMRRIEAVLRRVADIDSSLLLTGESGVGKEVAARFVHEISNRSSKPFVAVNCAAIPSDLLESELFGHEKAPSRVRSRVMKAMPSGRGTGFFSWTRSPSFRRVCRRNCFG